MINPFPNQLLSGQLHNIDKEYIVLKAKSKSLSISILQKTTQQSFYYKQFNMWKKISSPENAYYDLVAIFNDQKKNASRRKDEKHHLAKY